MTTTDISTEYHQRIFAALDGITAWAEQSGEFVAEQAPLVAQEIVHRSIVFGIVFGVIAILAPIMLGLFAAFLGWVLVDEDKPQAAAAGFGVSLILSAPICLAIFSVNVPDAIEAWAAPRLHVLKQVQEMLP